MVIKIKTIGIILREFTENDIDFLGNRSDLYKALDSFNTNLIGIPININWFKIKNVVSLCDGIILPGGSSINTNDFKLIEYLIQKNIPTLGICLGMQTMAQYFNNKQEIKVDNHYNTNKYVHKVIINTKSKLYDIVKQKEIEVNSRHHYAIPHTNMLINAKSEDNVIEGVELPYLKFFIGIEWHPESTFDSKSYQIIKQFINNL